MSEPPASTRPHPDTTTSTPGEVAGAVHHWMHQALADPALVMTPQDWPDTTRRRPDPACSGEPAWQGTGEVPPRDR